MPTPAADIQGDDAAPAISADAHTSKVDRRVEELLRGDTTPAELAPEIEGQDPADAAQTLERLEPETSAEIIAQMQEQAAALALAHMDPALAGTALLDIDEAQAAAYLGLMEPDDAADVVQSLPKERADALLKLLPPLLAARIGKLALYDPESAGGIMTTDIMVVPEDQSIGRAIERVKRHSIREHQSDVYVVDQSKRLTGTISLRTLMIADDDDLVQAHMVSDLDVLHPELDREEVARLFQRYDYISLPVVDGNSRPLGMVTIDDVVDIIEAEATEDAMKQVGAGADEAVYSNISTKLKGRSPWLLVNLLTATTASTIVLAFQGLIEIIPVAAAILPIIANLSGNSGQQTLALTLRGLVLGEIHRERVKPLLIREAAFGLLAGLMIGVVVAAIVAILGEYGQAEGIKLLASMSWRIGVVAGMAMTLAVLMSCIIGMAIPLLMKRLGADPATASTIFLTMMTDMLSFGAFLGILFTLRGWLGLAG